MNNKPITGHLTALITVLIWGTTFISTQILLDYLLPTEIIFVRYAIGYISLIICCPRFLKTTDKKHEFLFMGAAFFGLTLYQLLENTALTYTTANNVSIITTLAPFFTALASSIFLNAKAPKKPFYLGLVISLLGVILISYLPNDNIKINPTGDVLALLAAAMWAAYSVFTKKISDAGYSTLPATRRIFFYGLIFLAPLLLFTHPQVEVATFSTPVVWGNLLFLGVCASALCFVTWNYSIKLLGPIKSSVYIYMIPAATIITSAIFLNQPLTFQTIIGVIFVLAGLSLSQRK